MNFIGILSTRIFRYGFAIFGVALVTLLLEPFHEQLNSTTVALAFLLVILTCATFFGRNPAMLSACLASFLERLNYQSLFARSKRCNYSSCAVG